MNRVKRFIITHRFVIASFFLPFLILAADFAVMRIFPFGGNQITVIDMYHQYVPFLNELQYKLHHGGSLLYSWNGAGQEGDDLYFNASVDGKTYTFTVEAYLCDASTDVYKAVQELKIGDVVDMEGFLYWYEGPNPHITSVTAAK